MAEIDFDEVYQDHPAPVGGRIGTMVNYIAALTSVTLIAGLGWWGWQLMVRDVSGVPVVRALEGPMRVQPEDPGGDAADHLGLAVNNIPAVGEAAAPADRLVLAPRATGLAAEDRTEGELAAMQAAEAAAEADGAATQAASVAASTAPLAEVTPQAEAAEVEPLAQADLIAAALMEATGEADAATEGGETPAAATTDVAAPGNATVSPDLPGVTQSLVPLARPALLVPAALTTAAAQAEPMTQVPSTPAGTAGIDPATLPAGTRLAQLGAFETRQMAEAEWIRLSATYGEFLADKSQVIEEAQSGGKAFFRLRAHGFLDLNDARRFCAVLVAGQATCIPITTR